MILDIKDLWYKYPGKHADMALKGISAVVGPGLHLLLGENGAGKTTLLHIMAGLRFPSSGSCTLDGCPTGSKLPSVSSHIFMTGVNMEFPTVSVAQMARIHAPFYPHFDAFALHDNLVAFGLDADSPLQSMSTGNRQKAKVAYALALKTDILLLDEPANGLDIESRHALQKMMAAHVGPEQTVIVSTHSIRDLENLYDGVIDLHDGRLNYAMTVDDILEHVYFDVSSVAPEDAVYSRQCLGRCHSICPNYSGDESNIDFELLYLAARNNQEQLLKCLDR